MPILRFVAVVGNVTFPSKTYALAETIANTAASLTDSQTNIYSIGQLAGSIGAACRREEVKPAGERALRDVETADALIVASPVYRASYTGLLKHFFDLIEWAHCRPACPRLSSARTCGW